MKTILLLLAIIKMRTTTTRSLKHILHYCTLLHKMLRATFLPLLWRNC